MAPQTFVIVGASLAGAKAAETLRDEGFTGRIVLIGEESERPYDRPPLSKGYLRGEEERAKVYLHPEGFYAERDIELRTCTWVAAIEPSAAEVVLGGGERLGYDRLLLATGTTPRPLRVPGAGLPGVQYLRRLDDADRLHSALASAGRVVVIGGGWIGSEVAASARQLGVDVALIDPHSVPLQRVVGPEVGAVFRDLHADQGVDLHLGVGVEAIVGHGRAEGVRITDGRVLEADLVVVGVGVTPRTELAEAAGLQVGNGIVVDAFLETSVAGIFAAGDVAAAWHPTLMTHIRVEHWANALNQGPAAARAMLGHGTPYDQVPYFFSDQYDLGLEYSGYAETWDRVVFRGDPASRKFIAFWVDDGRVVAGMNVNVWDVVQPIQALVRAGRPVDLDLLADPSVPLEELGAACRRSRTCPTPR
jgi:3-phenylpropionate/trans-cinnamate dioxygenase ferredoxin reductase subunit